MILAWVGFFFFIFGVFCLRLCEGGSAVLCGDGELDWLNWGWGIFCGFWWFSWFSNGVWQIVGGVCDEGLFVEWFCAGKCIGGLGDQFVGFEGFGCCSQIGWVDGVRWQLVSGISNSDRSMFALIPS